jgi:hypothetical protein
MRGIRQATPVRSSVDNHDRHTRVGGQQEKAGVEKRIQDFSGTGDADYCLMRMRWENGDIVKETQSTAKYF